MDRIKEIWPRWHTVELIGRGAFGEVYKAKREELGETFYSAVKIISIPNDKSDIREMLAEGQTSQSIRYYYESIVKGLMNEIKMMEILKSVSNVVNIEEFEIREREDEIGWDAYIRMELLTSLNAYRAKHSFDNGSVIKLGKDICTALIYCEKNKIIHRDIKPSNIFVDEYGNFKLGDFGIARQLEKTQSSLSQRGTEMYMAPEVRFASGMGSYSYNADIYSMGLVMYRLLNKNRMPFEPVDKEMISYQEKEDALARRLRGEKPPFPEEADDKLGAIILKACEADRTKRYQSASEMLEDLQKEAGVQVIHEEKPREEKKTEQTFMDEETMSAFTNIRQEREEEKEPVRGKNVTITCNIDKERAEKGGEITITDSNGKELIVKVPAGSKDGKKLRIQRHGKPGENGGRPGDLYIQLRLMKTTKTKASEKGAASKEDGNHHTSANNNHSLKEPVRGKDVTVVHYVDSDTAEYGGQFRLVDEYGKGVVVNIPAKMTDGFKYVADGHGKKGKNGGEPGDLYIIVHIRKANETNDKNQLKGKDIKIVQNIQKNTAVNGGLFTLSAPYDRKITINIPPGIKDGYVFRFDGYGEPEKDGLQPGDLYVTVKIQSDDNLLYPIIVDKKSIKLGEFDVRKSLTVNRKDAANGCVESVSDGIKEKINIDIPSGVKTGQILKIPRKGKINHKSVRKNRGNLFVELSVTDMWVDYETYFILQIPCVVVILCITGFIAFWWAALLFELCEYFAYDQLKQNRRYAVILFAPSIFILDISFLGIVFCFLLLFGLPVYLIAICVCGGIWGIKECIKLWNETVPKKKEA